MKSSLPLVFLVTTLLPWTAQAHAHLDKAMPANGSVVTTLPETVSLKFDEAATLTALSIQKAGDKAAQRLGPLPKTPSELFTVALPKLTPGEYTVKYRVLTDDNHVMGGAIVFTIATDAKPAVKGMTIKNGDMSDMNMKGMDMTNKATNKTAPPPASPTR